MSDFVSGGGQPEQYAQEPEILDEDELDEVERALEEAGLSQGISAEDAEQMAELERELENEEGNNSPPPSPNHAASSSGAGAAGASASRAVIPEGALPSRNGKLSSAAAEFWFPECRNCPCCAGFKHGCKCRSPVVDTCTHPSCVDEAHVAASRATAASRPPPAPAAPSGPISHGTPKTFPPASAPAPMAAPGAAAGPGPYGGGASSEPCRFHNSPQGCRFGATCRNSHAGPGGGGGVGGGGGGVGGGGGFPPQMGGGFAPRGYPMPGAPGGYPGQGPGMGGGGGAQQPCSFFARGECKFGAGCRFAHI